LGPGIRYYVLSFAAIFLSLTVGLVIGSLFVSPRAQMQQMSLLSGMKKLMNDDVAQKRVEIEHYKDFVSAAMPKLIQKKLTGMTVAIVQTGDYPDVSGTVRDVLTLAGARVLSVTTVEKKMDQPDALLNADLLRLHVEDPRIPTGREELARTLAVALARGEASEPGIIQALDQAKLIQYDADGDYKTPARCVVVVAGSRSATARPVNVDVPIIAALQAQNLPTVACEPEAVLSSDIPTYRERDITIPAVGGIDTEMGRCALVFALRGEDFVGIQNPPGVAAAHAGELP
jgi:hypothetical protein